MSSLPSVMTAVDIREPGGPEVLEPVEIAVPTPRPGELLVRVAAAGVNRPDVLQRLGLYPVPKDASPLPGLEVAGEVVALGEGVHEGRLGQRVTALCNGGGYAEYVAVPAGQALPIPDGLSDAQAAALPETFFTVWYNVFQIAALAPDETLFVHGGASGIGTTAIQLAKAHGARVFVTAGTDDKCERCRDLGAEDAINYKQADFLAAMKERVPEGVDVILDMVGGDYLAKNVKLLGDRGRHVSIAFLRGPRAELDINAVMRRRLTLTGSTLRPRTADEKAAIAASLQERVWPWLAAGEVAPVIDSTYPLAEARLAHRRMEASDHVGKMILTVGEAS